MWIPLKEKCSNFCGKILLMERLRGGSDGNLDLSQYYVLSYYPHQVAGHDRLCMASLKDGCSLAASDGGPASDSTLSSLPLTLIAKPFSEKESAFYRLLMTNLQEYHRHRMFPRYYGTCTSDRPPHTGRTLTNILYAYVCANAMHARIFRVLTFFLLLRPGKYMLIEDLLDRYVHPTIIDIKLGRRTYDDDASASKIQSMVAKARTSTSWNLCFRISGMKVAPLRWNNRATGTYNSAAAYSRFI